MLLAEKGSAALYPTVSGVAGPFALVFTAPGLGKTLAEDGMSALHLEAALMPPWPRSGAKVLLEFTIRAQPLSVAMGAQRLWRRILSPAAAEELGEALAFGAPWCCTRWCPRRRLLVARRRPTCCLGGKAPALANQLAGTAGRAPMPEALRQVLTALRASLAEVGWLLSEDAEARATLVAGRHHLQLASPPYGCHAAALLLGPSPDEDAPACPEYSLDPGDLFVLSGSIGKRSSGGVSDCAPARASKQQCRPNALGADLPVLDEDSCF